MAIAGLLAAGCQSATVKSGAGPVAAAPAGKEPFTGNAIEDIDPCGDRMEDLCGPLIFYFRANHHGPSRLQELQPFALAGQTLNLACPVSGRPYLCAPQGLEADGMDIRIYVYDDAPVHGGSRWCAVKKGGSSANGAEVMYAVKIREEDFRKFRLSADVLPF